ncbi:MAG: ATP-binding protein [Ruminiclostridium sp.]|nr:ATP-binding protein [Ruminiclostridium sp.]
MTKSIAVAGKGGTGKSTIAALMVLYLKRNNLTPVLAIDSDPDSNLGTLLGIEPHLTLGDLKNETIEGLKNLPAGISKANYFETGLQEIIEESKGFDLITMGRGEGPGCYCYLNNLVRKFHEDLMNSYKWVVIDNEAGLEHISRRTTTNINSLIVVVNNNPISFHTAKRIDILTEKLKISFERKFVIGNMIKKEFEEDFIRKISELNMEYICNIPYSSELEEAVMKGEPVSNVCDQFDGYLDLIFRKIGGQ